MSISLPREMVREVDNIRNREHRTRSELVREALRTYFRAPYRPTPAELAAITKGRASESMTAEDFFAHVDSLAAKGRRQERRPRSRKRA